MFKKVGIIALACSILVSGAAFAETKEVKEVVDQTNYSISFDDEKEWLEDLKVNTADMAKLEVLYEEAMALEESGKEDQAEAKWNEFDAILDNYFEEEEMTFEDEKEWLEEMGVSKVDTTTLAILFNELIAFEENDQDDEAEAKWNEIDAILENYYNEEDYSFEEELEWLNEMAVSEADIATLEILFNEAIAFEENDQDEEAEAKWDEFDAILENYYDEENYSFEEELDWLNEMAVSEADITTLEILFNEAIALEENGQDEEAEAKWDEFDAILENYYDEESDFTFEEEKEWLEEIGVNPADMVKLEVLFNEVIALEENGKEEEADAKWDEIDIILENYDEEESDFTFEDEKEWLEEIGVNPADMVKLEALFNEVIALEENGKEDEAEAKWDEIDVILENYYEEETDFTFEEEKEWLEEIGINSADMDKLEVLFNELIVLEENGNEDEAEAKWNEIDTILENYYDSEETDEEESDFTFEEEKEWLEELGVSTSDTAILESLFNEVIALEENDKEDEAEAKWNEIDTILENYYDSEESDEEESDFTFEEEKEWLEELGVSTSDTAILESLFNEVMALEENDKEDEAEAKWNEIDNILENYFDDEDYDDEDYDDEDYDDEDYDDEDSDDEDYDDEDYDDEDYDDEMN